MLIASTATLGLLLVGVLALTMTPRRSASPVAASSTALGLRTPAAAETLGSALPLVTPVGDDGWGVTTASALTGSGGRRVAARLPSGEVVDVEIVSTDDDVTVVSLPTDTDAESFEVARSQPEVTDSVTVQGDDGPLTVEVGRLANVDVAEATPVLDDEGRLVGLCTGKPDARWLVPVGALPVVPTTTTAPTTSAPRPTTTTTTTIATPPVGSVKPIDTAPVTTIPSASTVPVATPPPATEPPTTVAAPTLPPTGPPSTAPAPEPPPPPIDTTAPPTTSAPVVRSDDASSGGTD